MLFLFFVFMVTPAFHTFAMEDYRCINLTEHQLEIACKTFELDDVEVQTLATIHFGDQAYFADMTARIKDQVVIYELKGLNFQQKIEREKIKDNLNPYYQRLFKNIRRVQVRTDLVAFHFGLALQSEKLDLSQARVLIHADINADPQMQKKYESPATLSKYLDAIRDELGFYADNDLSNQVCERSLGLPELKNELIAAFGPHANPSANSEFHARNKMVFDEIEIGLQSYKKILIVYGAWHQPYIAAFLQSRGFKQVKTEWVPVITLPPCS